MSTRTKTCVFTCSHSLSLSFSLSLLLNPIVHLASVAHNHQYHHDQTTRGHTHTPLAIIILLSSSSPPTRAVPGGDKTSGRRDVAEPETLATLERCFRLLTSGIGGGGGGGTRGNGALPGRRSSVPMTPSGGGGGANSGSNSGSSTSGTLLGRCLRRQTFEAIKHRVTCMDHNLFDVIWPALKKYSNAYASNSSLEDGNVNVRERRFEMSTLAPSIPLTHSAEFCPLFRVHAPPR